MGNIERTQLKTKLTQERYDLKRAKLEAEGILVALRAELRPAALCGVEELDLDRARDIFNDLHAKWRVVKALIKNIARLEEELE
jgi:hypothetical protein